MTYFLHTLESSDEALKPTGLRRLAHELALLGGFLLLLLMGMALLSYTQQDAAWSTSGLGSVIRNRLGVLGAWFADLAYFMLGFSAWLCLAVGFRVWFAVLVQRLRAGTSQAPAEGAAPSPPRRAVSLQFWLGVGALVWGATALEWSRMYRFEAYLPGHSGGVLGYVVGAWSVKWLGFSGAGLLAIVLFLLGASWAFGFSWLDWAERLGARIESKFAHLRQKRELAQDLQIGKQAVREREEVVSEDYGDGPLHSPLQTSFQTPLQTPLQRTVQAHAPVVIEPAAPAEVPQSKRVAKERQKPLFSEMPDSKLPQVALLDGATLRQETVAHETLEMISRMIEKKLKDFGVEVRVVLAQPGPVITRYEIEPATGVKGSQIVGLAKDLARSLSLTSIRVVETIPGKNFMALELPNAKRQSIKLSEILGSQVYAEAKSFLTMGLGKDIIGNPIVADLAKMPHVLVAGTTGSGKSVGINAMILSLLYKAEARDVRILMIDPKMLEMSVYEGIPHLLAPVVTDMKQAAHGLTWCVAEMERRYKLMSKMGVRNLMGYNTKMDEAKERGEFIYNPFSLTPDAPEPLDRLPHIVVVIDELADLMMVVGKKIEELIARLAQKARAAGIHLILATQRPSVDVITGLIKANIPTRIAFQVSSKIDSRTILDQMGAEALLGMGDMLYMPSGTGLPIRVHGAFVSDEEVHRVVSFLKSQGEPDYIEGVLEGGTVDGEDGGAGGADASGEKDPMYDQAVEVVLKNRKASISLVQRHLKIGYNRAARLVEDMEKAGLVSAMSGSGQRDILVPPRNGD
jgi:S-DNA-T family DNA segregation ATPase FtsK/SpoIIIE